MSLENLRVGVVGASIAGLMTAHALSRRGASVDLFERSTHLAERGSGVMLEARVAASIGGLCSRAYSRRQVLGSRLQPLWSRSLTKMACSWADLYRSLRARVPDSAIHAGQAVASCTQDGVLQLADGSQHGFDLIIGADGLGSTVRGCMGQDFQPTYCGYVALRGMLEVDQLPASARHLWHAVSTGSLLNHYARGCHAVIYAPPGATTTLVNWMWYCNVEDPEALFTDPDGQRHRWSLPPDRVSSQLRDQLIAQARAELAGPVVDMLEATSSPYLQAIYHGMPDHFSAGRIALVGDAAHVSPPHLGAATSIAYHDIQTLVDALEAGQPLHEWGRQRRQVVQTDLDMAFQLGQTLQHHPHPWDQWREADFDDWWAELTEGKTFYFDPA